MKIIEEVEQIENLPNGTLLLLKEVHEGDDYFSVKSFVEERIFKSVAGDTKVLSRERFGIPGDDYWPAEIVEVGDSLQFESATFIILDDPDRNY